MADPHPRPLSPSGKGELVSSPWGEGQGEGLYSYPKQMIP